MTVATQPELLDLRHFSARQLRPLLESEARLWKRRLHWDYQSSTELLLQYLDTRVLTGFVALDRGRICGFTFCVYEGNKAVIGDAYALVDGRPSLAISEMLLHHMLQLLLHSPDIDRIEAQLLLFDSGAIDVIFRSCGFQLFPRQFLEMQVAAHRPSTNLVPPQMVLARWTAADYNPAGELIHLAYAGHTDALINDQYRTLPGSLRFLHNVVRFPGCGVFDAESSWVLRDRKTGTLAGIVLCSNVGDHVAHVTQLCVSPTYRGRGLGRLLMRHCTEHLARGGFRAITLTVTEANNEAMRLYGDLGFETLHRFKAMVLEKTRS